MQKRFGQNDESESSDELAALETSRSAAASSSPTNSQENKDHEKMSVFWRVFGGTILSIAALVGITLFNNMYSNISELRTELSREREARAELIKKDEFNSRNTSIYDRIRTFDGLKPELEGLRERVTANAAALDGLKKDSAAILDAAKKELATITDTVRKDAAAIDVLKERVVSLEGVRKDVAGIDTIKDRLMTVTADLKSIRDDVSRVQQDIERNKAGDLERKNARDGQFKQVEESLKEVQKALQDCREKLARLEGMQPQVGPARPQPVPPATARPWFPVEEHPLRSVTPGESKGGGAGGDNPATSKPGGTGEPG